MRRLKESYGAPRVPELQATVSHITVLLAADALKTELQTVVSYPAGARN